MQQKKLLVFKVVWNSGKEYPKKILDNLVTARQMYKFSELHQCSIYLEARSKNAVALIVHQNDSMAFNVQATEISRPHERKRGPAYNK